ncbi:hypothetical protein CC80DRAFT_495329 [Byssothecium circinans]|uniref:Uncharacterized protein n=1 Tax=Byssothecium circinans TaxID=147558 RepID=A0A6A5TKU5_9PLEO|nr:hypothetical protein CC80DRAFT_495329 [Byssothecium circinans]
MTPSPNTSTEIPTPRLSTKKSSTRPSSTTDTLPPTCAIYFESLAPTFAAHALSTPATTQPIRDIIG